MIHENPYKEAMRYVDNAKVSLQQAGKEDKFYSDVKYIRTACGTAYSGILVALDCLFDIKSIPKRRGRKAIDYYQKYLAQIDKNLLNHLNNAYTILHLDGYYGGIKSIKAIESGFDSVISVINALKPYSNNGAE
jgi:TATA-binding protein-associated factor Taf7